MVRVLRILIYAVTERDLVMGRVMSAIAIINADFYLIFNIINV